LPTDALLYVGRATAAKLARHGIGTIGAIAQATPAFLEQLLGVNGKMLWEFANGQDCSHVAQDGFVRAPKSIGNSTTAPRDLVCEADFCITMRLLCESVAARLRKHGLRCRTVQIWLRGSDLQGCERQMQLDRPTCLSDDLFGAALALYRAQQARPALRSVGVRALDLQPYAISQTTFLPEEQYNQKMEQLECAIDRVRSRYGFHAVRRARLLGDAQLSDLDPMQDHIVHPVGYLATRKI
ncbi:MAG: DNA polymerase IV, partial [Oscillospiraceae bacterium]|nr:DNA polymerase IV [Oscillospiraceae bacterium]